MPNTCSLIAVDWADAEQGQVPIAADLTQSTAERIRNVLQANLYCRHPTVQLVILEASTAAEANRWSRQAKAAHKHAQPLIRGLAQQARLLYSKTGPGGDRYHAPAKISVDANAIGCLAKNPGWSNRQIAAAIGCHEKTLSCPNRVPEFTRARAAIALNKREVAKGSRNRRSGDIEAYETTGD